MVCRKTAMMRVPLRAIWTVFIMAVALGGFSPVYALNTGFMQRDTLQAQSDGDKNAEKIVATLDDTQVRRMLIAELRKSAAAITTSGEKSDDQSPYLHFFKQIEKSTDSLDQRATVFLKNILFIPDHAGDAYRALAGKDGLPHVLFIAIAVLGIWAAGYLGERAIRRLVSVFGKKAETAPTLEGGVKVLSALLKSIPEWVGLVTFALISMIVFLGIFDSRNLAAGFFFIPGLAVILMVRIVALFSRLICSPGDNQNRFLPLSDDAALMLHRHIVRLAAVTAFGLAITSAMRRRLHMPSDTIIFTGIIIGTVLVLYIAGMIRKNRDSVRLALKPENADAKRGGSWLQHQFADVWHILAYIYLFIVWMAWAGRLILLQSSPRSAFFASLLIVPIYLLLDRVGVWLVDATIGSLKTRAPESEDRDAPGGSDEAGKTADGEPSRLEAADISVAEASVKAGEERYALFARKGVRIAIAVALGFWLLELWGIRIPFADTLVAATFDILVTLVLAHILWSAFSRFIDRKLNENMPPDSPEEADADQGEWASTANLGRHHTLLPMLRKFVGAVLAVMVTLIVLSAIGVDIGPLLAGAGVVGIAIGFGAQKLVADVLSGIFYLLDDAFRVGEYIEAGNVSGVVENITLRNVKLRHHRGMLQLIPFSDLGSITNFMRGGIVEKFSLVLPYDTDIDKVRKIIKKVGIAMLEDPEIGPDFIKPVKSQGVRSVGDSVMTFRVKFTARPGKHFLIRREAFRRITEALAKKGIHYAHRKVIVDLPEDLKKGQDMASADINKGSAQSGVSLDTVLKTGAAAAGDILANEAADGASGAKKK